MHITKLSGNEGAFLVLSYYAAGNVVIAPLLPEVLGTGARFTYSISHFAIYQISGVFKGYNISR